MGNATAIPDYDDFCDMTDLMLATMCPHTMAEFVSHVYLMFPAVYEWAEGFCKTMEEFIASVALKFKDVFQWALGELSVGCYQVRV